MKNVTLSTLQKHRQEGSIFSCLTAYDATLATLASQAGIHVLLIGDSLGMVLQGHDSTVPVTMQDMIYHTRCVARANTTSLVMADIPFMAHATTEDLLHHSAQLMQAGAHMVKVEGEGWLADGIQALTQRGIPVCAHMGLTPQSVNAFGGYRVQGRSDEAAHRMISDARHLVSAGAAVILLECVPRQVALALREEVNVPVIGIGAGPDVDGQILVMHDMLGATTGRMPRFVKNFMTEASSIQEAFEAYHLAVTERRFPAEEHCF
ncbi:3-methyl-2-oxobutanoate hydroxymethyltransferase [Larsenimonas rhizosphaerae]|uniref:3-methyl-2-oxobutanoate hydroxymethyltransferase n=1 Tax=Larsenimonas rhizosphaerae TaxID=2944682 RepID=A0AA42CUW9_9GAMM|nr:3-methyl-2-oxobutanoate hydroxymethyltransferase [Larsenimonas rhizosphaerae]MCM2131576.1 3-methyl-2-oxobutanoate hydroxymethyltransferase [Larsenimonas rhizosphaerae]MCX2525097.1 3-methyl-2-oxobutanoate hydroxymethyltransferase [Larsenimonas rhizosphaerae]